MTDPVIERAVEKAARAICCPNAPCKAERARLDDIGVFVAPCNARTFYREGACAAIVACLRELAKGVPRKMVLTLANVADIEEWHARDATSKMLYDAADLVERAGKAET